MKKNLITISSSILLASMLVGCGGSSSSNDEKPTDPIDPKPPVDVKKCTYSVAGKVEFKIDEEFKNELLKVTIKDGKDKDVTATAKFAGTVDTKKEGSYDVTVSSESCSTTKIVTVKVKKPEPKPVDGESDDPLVSPF